MAEDFDFFFALASKVKDGTPCSEDKKDICIDGICMHVGCDLLVGSWAERDACGVCQGRNLTCQVIRGEYHQQHHVNEYHTMLTLPVGARNIVVYELNISSSYLALRDLHGQFLLNGGLRVDWPGKHYIAGTSFDYRRPFDQPESLTAAGPINASLMVEILIQGKNSGIAWEYVLPENSSSEGHIGKKLQTFSWVLVYSSCSKSCGGGKMAPRAVCVREQWVQVNQSFCSSIRKPPMVPTECNNHACPPSWQVGEWTPCSRSCGGGKEKREALCLGGDGLPLKEKSCLNRKPPTQRSCEVHACPPKWHTEAWTECSKSCGRGIRKRALQCRSMQVSGTLLILPDANCNSSSRPQQQQFCVLQRCRRVISAKWFLSSWSHCSVTCGQGIQHRRASCGYQTPSGKLRSLAMHRCRRHPRPTTNAMKRHCFRPACPQPHNNLWRKRLVYTMPHDGGGSTRAERPVLNAIPKWKVSPWSQCTVSCGGGVHTRIVQCMAHGRPAVGCLSHLKPADSVACNTSFCSHTVTKKGEEPCKDSHGWCYLVPQHKMCNHNYYGKQCCRSCSRTNLLPR
uniref:PLAC domain-containing protein n=1 Tax=Eptatretus burgeri TaxID=7764 RepID=A0A8C4QUG6_EPTBU